MPPSVIAVDGVPAKWPTSDFMKKLAKLLVSNFTCLGFDKPTNSYQSISYAKQIRNPFKTFYVELPHSLKPYETIDKINRKGLQHGLKYVRVTAYIPLEIPDLKQKPKRLPDQLKKILHIRDELLPEKAILVTYNELLIEMQSKYTELYNLSAKNDHKLLTIIGKEIHSRLYEIMETNQSNCKNGFLLSKKYRKIYPHFGDYELILNSYQQIVPGGYINNNELINVKSDPYSIDQVPSDKIQTVCLKYSKIITEKVNEHLASLKTDIDMARDSEEDVARKKVRAELKKLTPYMGAIVKEVIVENFMSLKSPFHRIRIYGEPFMHSKETMEPILKRYHPVRITRSEKMFNLLLLNVPPLQCSKIIALDGTVINGVTMIVRSSDMPSYLPVTSLKQRQEDYIAECPEDDEGMDEEYPIGVNAEDFQDVQDFE